MCTLLVLLTSGAATVVVLEIVIVVDNAVYAGCAVATLVVIPSAGRADHLVGSAGHH